MYKCTFPSFPPSIQQANVLFYLTTDDLAINYCLGNIFRNCTLRFKIGEGDVIREGLLETTQALQTSRLALKSIQLGVGGCTFSEYTLELIDSDSVPSSNAESFSLSV